MALEPLAYLQQRALEPMPDVTLGRRAGMLGLEVVVVARERLEELASRKRPEVLEGSGHRSATTTTIPVAYPLQCRRHAGRARGRTRFAGHPRPAWGRLGYPGGGLRSARGHFVVLQRKVTRC